MIFSLKDLLITILGTALFSFTIAFPIIQLLYKLKITRRMTVDFTTLIEKRNLKIGVPIMGGLIIIISVVLINLFLNPGNQTKGILLILLLFLISAALGGFDDVLNIYGRDREKPRSLARILKLIRVHKSIWKRIRLIIALPWLAYKSFFYILGSNPGKGIQAHEKILVQSIAGILLGAGLYFSASSLPGVIYIPFLDSPLNLSWLIIPFAWITTLLMTNAVNLADGMDGLATNELLFSFVGFLIIAILKGDARITFLVATVIGSLLAYLYFNIPPARFQMGDVGSLALGTLLTSIAFFLREPLMLLIISLPFAITLVSTVIQGFGRRILGRRIFAMAPIHYHFQMKYGWSEEKVVMRFTLFSMLCMLVGLLIFVL